MEIQYNINSNVYNNTMLLYINIKAAKCVWDSVLNKYIFLVELTDFLFNTNF